MSDVEMLRDLSLDELEVRMREHRGDHELEGLVGAEKYRRACQRNFERNRNVPKALEIVSLGNVQIREGQSPTVHVLEDVAAGLETGAYIYGNTGSGKSHLAAGLVNDQVKLGRRAIWVAWLGLIRDQQSRIRGDTGEPDMMATAKGVDLLVLDDFGTALRATAGGRKVASDFAVTLAEELLDARLYNKRQTVITSNLDPARLNAAYGSRVASRLVDLCHAVRLQGTDHRLARRKARSARRTP